MRIDTLESPAEKEILLKKNYKSMEEEKILTVDEVTQMLKLPRSFVYEHTRRGAKNRMPALRFGKHLRFVKEEVEKWGRKRYEKGF